MNNIFKQSLLCLTKLELWKYIKYTIFPHFSLWLHKAHFVYPKFTLSNQSKKWYKNTINIHLVTLVNQSSLWVKVHFGYNIYMHVKLTRSIIQMHVEIETHSRECIPQSSHKFLWVFPVLISKTNKSLFSALLPAI